MVTIPSSSIMKLTNKSISSHPTVAALLKSVKQMGLYTASPLPIMHEDVDVEFEFDLNKVLEKQIEEINISANGVANEITVDISEGVKGNYPYSLLYLFDELWFAAICLQFFLHRELETHMYVTHIRVCMDYRYKFLL